MDTRAEIIKIGDILIREKGYNAFSFADISKQLNIKNASVHYHFPAKADLGIAIIQQQTDALKLIIAKYRNKTPVENLEKFLSIYTHFKSEGKVCMVGSLATDLNTLDEKIKEPLKVFSARMIDWVKSFLENGQKQKTFQFNEAPRTKAMMIIGTIMAALQITRLTNDKDFKMIKEAIKHDLLKTKKK